MDRNKTRSNLISAVEGLGSLVKSITPGLEITGFLCSFYPTWFIATAIVYSSLVETLLLADTKLSKGSHLQSQTYLLPNMDFTPSSSKPFNCKPVRIHHLTVEIVSVLSQIVRYHQNNADESPQSHIDLQDTVSHENGQTMTTTRNNLQTLSPEIQSRQPLKMVQIQHRQPTVHLQHTTL